jgi:hypothetical protein
VRKLNLKSTAGILRCAIRNNLIRPPGLWRKACAAGCPPRGRTDGGT